jgi:hypothetical protein
MKTTSDNYNLQPSNTMNSSVQSALLQDRQKSCNVSDKELQDILHKLPDKNIWEYLSHKYSIKNNLITNQREISVKSKQYPYSEKELFTFKDISESKSKDYTIEIQSIIPDLYITSRFYVDENMTNDVKTIQLINTII